MRSWMRRAVRNVYQRLACFLVLRTAVHCATAIADEKWAVTTLITMKAFKELVCRRCIDCMFGYPYWDLALELIWACRYLSRIRSCLLR